MFSYCGQSIYYFAQHGFNPGKSYFTTPYDASAGVPAWFWLSAAAFFLYVGIRVYIEIQKDKK